VLPPSPWRPVFPPVASGRTSFGLSFFCHFFIKFERISPAAVFSCIFFFYFPVFDAIISLQYGDLRSAIGYATCSAYICVRISEMI
jgi:hypothetical protein